MYDFFATLMLLGALSSSGNLPFWATAGQYGLMPEASGTLALVQARTAFNEADTFQWRWGASLAACSYNDERDPGSLWMNSISARAGRR